MQTKHSGATDFFAVSAAGLTERFRSSKPSRRLQKAVHLLHARLRFALFPTRSERKKSNAHHSDFHVRPREERAKYREDAALSVPQTDYTFLTRPLRAIRAQIRGRPAKMAPCQPPVSPFGPFAMSSSKTTPWSGKQQRPHSHQRNLSASAKQETSRAHAHSCNQSIATWSLPTSTWEIRHASTSCLLGSVKSTRRSWRGRARTKRTSPTYSPREEWPAS